MDLRGWDVRGVAVGAVVALVLAGCNGDPEVEVTPTPTPVETVAESPSPTPSPSPTALTEEEVLAAIPENMLVEDFLSATRFSRYFVELYPAMFSPNGDTKMFYALSAPGCKFCADALASAVATDAAGAHSVGSDFTWGDLISDSQGGRRDDGYWYVAQPFQVTATTTYAADGTVLSEDEAGSGVVGLKLSWSESRWHVNGVEFHYDDDE